MTREEWDKGIEKWRQSGYSNAKPSDPAPTADDSGPSTLGTIGQGALDFGKGALKGAGSNVTGLVTAAHNVIGTPDLPQSVKDLTATGPDAGWAESAGHLVGDYGSLAIPGLDFGLGAKLGAKAGTWAMEHGPEFMTLYRKLGGDRAQQVIEAMWSARNAAEKGGSLAAKGAIGGVAHDPEHPGEGAAIGAATPVVARSAGSAAKAALGKVPQPARWLADKLAIGGSIYGAERLARGEGRGGPMSGVPAWYVGHNIPSALAALAAIALGAPAGIQGAAGADVFGSGNNQ